MSSVKINIQGVDLLPWQKKVFHAYKFTDYKNIIIATGRQQGKSLLLSQLILDAILNESNRNVGVISLTFRQVKLIYQKISKFLSKIPNIVITDNKSELYIELINGSKVTFLSAMNGNSIRGNTFTELFCNEAAFYPPELISTVIEPTALIMGRKCAYFSTPRGTQNEFFTMWSNGNNPQIKNTISFRFDYTHGLIPVEELEQIRKAIPEHIFKQEYGAEFNDSGGIFTNVLNVSILNEFPLPKISNERYYAGIDIGVFQDYTVCSIMDSKGRLCAVLRVRLGSVLKTQEAIFEFLQLWGPEQTYIEVNNQGQSIFEWLRLKYKKKLQPFHTTNESKEEIINLLSTSIENGEILLPNTKIEPQLYTELSNFSFTISPKSKKIIYGGRSGFHDDMVISLALANKSYQQFHGQNKKPSLGYRIRK